MRILFVIKTLGYRPAGAERVLVSVAGALAERGNEVIIADFDASDAATVYPIHPSVARVRLAAGNVEASTRAVDVVRRALHLRRLLRVHQPDVAVGFMHSAYVPLAGAALGTGVPVVGSEHIVHSHYRNRPFERLSLRLAAPLLNAATAISETMRGGFPDAMRRKMTVIPNPVTVESRERGAERSNLVLTVGRLEPQKDQATLIDAFERIAEDYPDWRLRIIGEGPLRELLETRAAAAGLGSRAQLPGTSNDIAAEYARADLFVMPSRYESFGLVTAEALAAGLPVIGFADCPGTNELIIPGVNGLLVDGADRVSALAAGLADLMGSAERRAAMAAAGPASVERYSLPSISDQWEQLLRTVAASR